MSQSHTVHSGKPFQVFMKSSKPHFENSHPIISDHIKMPVKLRASRDTVTWETVWWVETPATRSRRHIDLPATFGNAPRLDVFPSLSLHPAAPRHIVACQLEASAKPGLPARDSTGALRHGAPSRSSPGSARRYLTSPTLARPAEPHASSHRRLRASSRSAPADDQGRPLPALRAANSAPPAAALSSTPLTTRAEATRSRKVRLTRPRSALASPARPWHAPPKLAAG